MGIEQNGRQEEREQILGTPPLVPPGSANRGEDLRNDPEMAPAPPLGEPGPRRRTAASPATVSPAHVQMYHAAKYEPGGDDEMGQVMRLIFSPSQRLVAGRDARPHTAPLVDDFLAGLEGHTDNKVDHTPEQRKGGAGADNESAPTPQQRNGDSTGAGSESTPPPKSRALPPQTPQTPRALREAAVTSAGALLTAAVFVPGTDLLAVAGTDKRLVLHSLAVGATPNQQKQGPKIHFMPAQRMRDGYSQPLVDAGRFQVISSPFLLAQGARRYCWLMPGEELTDAGGGAPWCPCHHGGFVYLFSEELNYECYFSISPGEPNESASVQGLMFPDTLGPFTVVTTALRPDLDVETTSWKITHSEPQVQKLMSFGVKVGGSLSPVSRLTLPDDVKRANNIPLDATHFVYCYQGCDLDALMALEPAQTAQLRKGSSEVSFLAIGGFVYINAASDEPEDIQEATVCGANAITIDGDDADKLLGSESASLSKPVVLERPCPLTALAAVPDGCATLAQLQAKLAPLNSRALLRYAEAAGLDESQIEAADEADNRKGAFEALILGHYDPRATESLLCVADAAGWVGVYTPSRWLKTTQPLKVPPLGQAEHGTGVASVVFSPKGDLIFVMLQSGDVLARDARSSTLSLIRKLEFHGCDGFGQGALSCADGLIAAVGGCAVNNARAGDVDSSRVAVWQLADLDKPPNQFTVANDANAVAVRPDGKELAIGTGNGTICIFSSGTTTEHGALDDPHGRSAVNTVNYSTDGKLLAAGRVSGVHTVYEVATAAVIAIFNCPNGLGAVQAFPPAGDVLAVGGHQSAKVTLRMLCPPTPIRCATIDGLSGHAGLHDIEKRKDLRRNAVVDAVLTQLQPAALEGSPRSRGQLSGAFVSRTALVAITIGQRLQVQNKFDDILWEITLGEPVGANMLMHNPVTMRPDSKQVACIVSAGARVIVRMMSDGSEAFTLGPWRGHKCFSVGWSPDGQYLVVMGSRGTSVHDQSGIELRVMRDGPGNVMGHAFGSKGDTMFLATCGSSNRVTIRSMSAPKVHFLPAQRMREGYSQQLVDAGRVQEITSPFLYEMGARQYCWLLPGEELTGTRGSDPWCPCPHGGFVYIFSKEHDYECYFSISDQVLNMRNSTFPDAIGPFTVLASTLRPELDFDKNTWKITQSEAQMQLLKDFGIAVAGALSPASPITLPHKVKRKNNIPLDATHFVFCYGGCDLSTLQQNQSSQLTAGSPELSFVSIGGFAYIKAASNLPADIRTGKVVGANAITVDPDADVDPRTTEWAIAQSLPRENGPVSCVCFDATCERIAYFTSAGHKCGTVVVRTFDGGDEKRFPGANAFGTLAFSPNGQFLVAAGADLDKCGGRALTVLDLAIDEEASWGTFFSAMSLPPGRILGNSIRWVEPPVANEGEVVRTAQLMLQVVVEDRLIVVDLMASKYAIEDHAWSTGQLIKLSEHDPAAVESVAAKAPHLINVRDDEGDTVLHELMRWRKALQIDKWFTVSQTRQTHMHCVAAQ
jgi:WD40 repeat protein